MTKNNILLQINSYGMGRGDKSLGIKLIQKYFELQTQEESAFSFIIFYNEGVKLLTNNSPVIDSLKELEKKGTKLIACSTCLEHYDLIDNLEVGIAGGMSDIVTLQAKADKIITL